MLTDRAAHELTADAVTERIPRPPRIHPFAGRAVLPVVAVVGVLHLVASLSPGWWFDEATTVVLGRDHLMWGYADQPPLAPALAFLVEAVAPGSLPVQRLPAVLATAAAVLIAALVARELGGDRRAQTLTALAQATTVWGALTGHWATPYTLEPFLWLTMGWLLVRWLRVRHDRLLVWLGVAVGVAAETRFQVMLLGAVLLVVVLIVGPRDLLRRPALWLGVLVAAVLALPTLVWQAGNGWPQLRMGTVAAGEASELFGGPGGIAVLTVALAGVLGGVLLVIGSWHLVRTPELRFLVVTFGVLAVFFAVAGGRPYYLAGLWGVLAAAGAIRLQRRRESGRRRRQWMVWPAAALSIAVAAAMLWSSTVDSTTGRPAALTIASSAATAYRGLSVEDRARTAVLAQSYVEAAYLDTYGRDLGLPPVHSTNRGYAYLPPPSESQDEVLYVGESPDELRPYFPDVRLVSDTGKDSRVWLARGRVQPWSAIWPRMRHLDVS